MSVWGCIHMWVSGQTDAPPLEPDEIKSVLSLACGHVAQHFHRSGKRADVVVPLGSL
jgi:hypothetical protein